MFTSLYGASLQVLGGLGTAFQNIIDFLFNYSIAYHINNFLLSDVFTNPLFSPVLGVITGAVVNGNEFLTSTSFGDLILGTGVLTLIGFIITKYILEIIR